MSVILRKGEAYEAGSFYPLVSDQVTCRWLAEQLSAEGRTEVMYVVLAGALVQTL